MSEDWSIPPSSIRDDDHDVELSHEGEDTIEPDDSDGEHSHSHSNSHSPVSGELEHSMSDRMVVDEDHHDPDGASAGDGEMDLDGAASLAAASMGATSEIDGGNGNGNGNGGSGSGSGVLYRSELREIPREYPDGGLSSARSSFVDHLMIGSSSSRIVRSRRTGEIATGTNTTGTGSGSGSATGGTNASGTTSNYSSYMVNSLDGSLFSPFSSSRDGGGSSSESPAAARVRSRARGALLSRRRSRSHHDVQLDDDSSSSDDQHIDEHLIQLMDGEGIDDDEDEEVEEDGEDGENHESHSTSDGEEQLAYSEFARLDREARAMRDEARAIRMSRESIRRRAVVESGPRSPRVKKEPVDQPDANMNNMSDVPTLSPQQSPVVVANFNFPLFTGGANENAPSLLEPDAFMRGVQAQMIASIPATVTHIFSIVEEKLAALKAIKGGGVVNSSSSGGTAPRTAGPGVIADARRTIEKLKSIQSMIEQPLFAGGAVEKAPTTSASAGNTVSGSSGSASKVGATGASSTSISSASTPDMTNEQSAFTAVLVQALLTFLAICHKAKALTGGSTTATTKDTSSSQTRRTTTSSPSPMSTSRQNVKEKDQPSTSQQSGEKEKDKSAPISSAAATSSSGASPIQSWFPTDRLSHWKLLLCESLCMLNTDSTASPPSSSTASGSSPTADFAKHMKRILVFLCQQGGTSGTHIPATVAEKHAHALRDALVFEREFITICELFDLPLVSTTKPLHVDPQTNRIISTTFTACTPDIMECMGDRILGRRSLPYPSRLKLLSCVQRIESLAKRRSESFMKFVLNRDVDGGAIPPGTVNPLVDAAGAPSSPPSVPHQPRGKLIYLLYLLSLHLTAEDEELPAVMNLIGIIGQFIPQAERDYAVAIRREKCHQQQQQHESLLSPVHRPPSTASSAPAPVVSPPPSLPLFRSNSGGTVMSTLLSPPIRSYERKDGREEKDREQKTEANVSMEDVEPTMSQPGAAVPDASTPPPPTMFASMFDFLLSHRSELLFGFIQRHLLESGSPMIRAHACSFMFLSWRSLSTQEKRRSFFNEVISTFIDGRTNISYENVRKSSSPSPASLTSLAFYGAHAREYLHLFNTIIMDSRHQHEHVKKDTETSGSITKETKPSDSPKDTSGPTDMEIDSSSAPSAAVAPTAATLSSAPILTRSGSFIARFPSPTPMIVGSGSAAAVPSAHDQPRVHDDESVEGLTEQDCAVAIRRFLDVLSAQAQSFQWHPLLPYYSRLQAFFDPAPNQHYLQSCLCAVCNGRTNATASSAPTRHPFSAAYARFEDSIGSMIGSGASGSLVGDGGWATHNLKDLASEQKYTHCSRTIKLHSPQTVHQLQLKITGVPVSSSAASSGAPSSTSASGQSTSGSARHRPASSSHDQSSGMGGLGLKHVKTISVYFSEKSGVELAALPLPTQITKPTPSNATSTEGNDHWTLARSIELADTSVRDVKIVFPIGFHATAICIHFSDFFETFDAASEGLVCPRCLIPVASRASQCSRCRESVGQCLRCRAIDYEHPDAFQCGECAHSRYGTFTFTIQTKPSTFVPPITSEVQRKSVMSKILSIQEKISNLLNDDKAKLKSKILQIWKQGSSRIKHVEPGEQGSSATHTLTSSHGSSTANKKHPPVKPETRLDYRHIPSSPSTLGTPPAANAMRSVYECEIFALYKKLCGLYRELQLNRNELFLYLHGNDPFYLERKKAAGLGQGGIVVDDTDMSGLSASPSSSSLALSAIDRLTPSPSTTSCYGCSKNFLLLGLSLIHELDIDCLASGHHGGSNLSAEKDLDLFMYFLKHSVTSAPNPFVQEAAFMLHASSQALSVLIKYNDDAASDLGSRWLENMLEQKIVHLVKEACTVDGRMGESSDIGVATGDETQSELLRALIMPLFDLVTDDLNQVSLSGMGAKGSSFNIVGMAARLKILFRLLMIALKHGGTHSAAVSKFVVRPVLALLIRATRITDAERDVLAGDLPGTTASVDSTHTKSKDRSLSKSAATNAAGERSITMDVNMTPAQLRHSLAAGEMDEFLRNHFGLPASLAGSIRWSIVPSSIQPRTQTATAPSVSTGGSGGILSSGTGPSSNQLPGTVPIGVRRVSSGTGSHSPSIGPSSSSPSDRRRTTFQRSPGMNPHSSPGSGRISGRAGRVSAPGSASQKPQPDPIPSSSPLPPLSLEVDSALTVQALANELLYDVRRAWTLNPTAASSVDLPAWILAPGDHSAALTTFETWMRNKQQEMTSTGAVGAATSVLPTIPEPVRSLSQVKQLNSILSKVLDSVFAMPASANFRQPFSTSMSDMDDGDSMDLTTIRSKVDSNSYKDRDEFMHDIGRIVFLAEVYRGATIYDEAMELARIVQQELNKSDVDDALFEIDHAKQSSLDGASPLEKLKAAHATEWKQMVLAQKVIAKLRFMMATSRKSQISLTPFLPSTPHERGEILHALLLCPITSQIRQYAAQLVWNLALPTHSKVDLDSIPPFKPPTKKAARKLRNPTAAMAVKNALDAPVDGRVYAFVRTLVHILGRMDHRSALFSKQFFHLFSHLLHPNPIADARFKHYAVVHGLVPIVLSKFERELQEIEREENSLDFVTQVHHLSSIHDSSVSCNTEDVHKHHALHGLTVLLSCLLDDPILLEHYKTTRMQSSDGVTGGGTSGTGLLLGEQIMSFFLRIRGLMLVHSKMLDLCSGYLNHIISNCFAKSDREGKRATLLAYVYALSAGRQEQQSPSSTGLTQAPMVRAVSNASTTSTASASASTSSTQVATRLSPPLNPHISIYILEQLCDLIKPPVMETQCLINFKKSSTQEEYIRGNMKRAPYMSSSFAPPNTPNHIVLFRDIKNAICTQLKLDEELPLELLVDGRIVAPEVPVMKMYNRWYGEQSESIDGPKSGAVTAVVKAGGGIMVVSSSPSMSPTNPDGEDGGGDGDEDPNEEQEIDLLADGAIGGQQKSTVLLASDSPMTVLYRLTGLDGEATEEKIDSIPDEEKKVEDPEVEFALAGALVESGLRVLVYRLFQSMPSVRSLSEDVEVRLVSLLLKLLTYATKLSVNRTALLQLPAPLGIGSRNLAVPFVFRVLVDKLVLTLRAAEAFVSHTSNVSTLSSLVSASSVASSSASSGAAPLLALSLEIISLITILIEAYAAQERDSIGGTGADGWNVPNAQLQALLSCLGSSVVKSNPDLSHRLLSLIPLLSFGNSDLIRTIEAHFTCGFDLQSFDVFPSGEVQSTLESFAVMAESIPKPTIEKPATATTTGGASSSSSASSGKLISPPIGLALRSYFERSGLVQKLFSHLAAAAASAPAPVSSSARQPQESKDASGDVNMTPAAAPTPTSSTSGPPRSSKKRGRESDEVESSVQTLKDKPSLPFLLRILTGLVCGHEASQSLASKMSIIRVLQQLEGMASSTRVGPLAESLLQALMIGNTDVSDQIDELRGNKRQEKKKKALDQRAKMLAKMGFKQQTGGKGTNPADLPVFKGMEGLEESEHALKCSVCQEGYQYTASNRDGESSHVTMGSRGVHAGAHGGAGSSAMGFYVYNHMCHVGLSSLQISTSMDDGDSSAPEHEESIGLTTVTHFNLIHYKCHQEACKADRKLKPPKTEWEGATIRNQHTLCNNLFPILQPPNSVIVGENKGVGQVSASTVLSAMQSILAQARGLSGSPSTSPNEKEKPASALLNPVSPLWDASDIDNSLDQYHGAVEQYWNQIPFSPSFSHSRLEILLEDLRALLSRFATQQSFSNISKGGGKESNIKFIPYMVQMAGFLYQTSTTSTSAKEKIDGHIATAVQVLGGIDTTSPKSTSGGVELIAVSGTGQSRLSFGALPFLDPSIGAAYGGSSSGSPAASSTLASSSPNPAALSASLTNVLASTSLHDLVPSSHKSGHLIRNSLYADPLDYLEYLMVLSLVFLSPQHWHAIKFPLLWRMIGQSKAGLQMDFTDSDLPASSGTVGTDVEMKEPEQKDQSGGDEDVTMVDVEGGIKEIVQHAQLEVLRPILLFWSLVDSLHSVLSPPTGSSYTASSMDSFLSSTSSSSFRRWNSRRSFARNSQLATFRSILRREHHILSELTDTTLPQLEKLSSIDSALGIIEATPGVKSALEAQSITPEALLTMITETKKHEPSKEP